VTTMTRPRHRIVFALSAIACIAMLAACHGGNDDDPEAAAETLEKALAPREVRLVEPEVRDENPTIDLVGEVRAYDTLIVSSEVGGKVDRVFVEVGDRVSSGTQLLEVDRETFEIYLNQAEAELAAARADLDLAAKDLERKRDLRSDETIPEATLDQAHATHELTKARMAATEAALRLAKRNHDRSVVRAPSAGAITERFVVAGQWAEVGEGLLEMAVGDEVKIAALVPETWAAKLAGLESFSFTVGVGGASHTARLYSIQPVVREASRSFEVVGTAPNDGSLRPGMFANVVLASPTMERSLWLPATAVATSDLPQVLLVEDGTIVFRKIQTGRRLDGMIEVVSGLGEDEAVIAEVAGLHRGLPVKVVE